MPKSRHLTADLSRLEDSRRKLLRALGDIPSSQLYARQLIGEVAETLRELAAEDRSALGRNPPLAMYFNPSKLRTTARTSDIIARHVSAIIYMHDADGRMYVHGFGSEPVMRHRGAELVLSELSRDSNVRAIAVRDGSVRLVHADGLTLWGDY